MTLADELLALDCATLQEPTGGPLDAHRQAQRIAESLQLGPCLTVRRAAALVAYALLQPQDVGQAFVRGFTLHPQARNAAVLGELLSRVLAWMQEAQIERLSSHVLKGNAASLALHQKLGFKVSAENERAYAFTAERTQLLQHPALRRIQRAAPAN
jgi:RimJ/RimL family protein N-acetyltransferase